MGMIRSFVEWWRKRFVLAVTLKFLGGVLIGFPLGVYFFPIIVADGPVGQAVLAAENAAAEREAVFVKDLPGSDGAHWGEGTLLLSGDRVTLMGRVSPGPDYRLYLTPEYVDTGQGFLGIKDRSVEVARVKGFKDFSYQIDPGIDQSQYDSVVIWCERFSAFITAGRLTAR